MLETVVGGLELLRVIWPKRCESLAWEWEGGVLSNKKRLTFNLKNTDILGFGEE